MPVVRIPDECTYYKEDAGKLLIGAFEPVAKPWGTDGIPEDHAFETLPEDMDHFEPILADAVDARAVARDGGHRPLLQRAGKLHARRPLLSRRGAGDARTSSSPPASTRSASSRRAAPAWCSPTGSRPGIRRWTSTASTSAASIRSSRCKRYVRDRTVESLGLLYAMHWPYRQVETARGVRRSPIHDRLDGARRVLRRGQRLGAAELVRAEGRRARIRIFLRPAELVALCRRGGQGAAGQGRLLRPVELREVPGRGRRCREGAEPHLGQRGRRRARPHRLHPVAQRARRHRGRPHGHAPGRRRASWW